MTMSYLNKKNGSQYYNFQFILILLLIICFFKESRGGDIEHDYKDALTKSILFFEGQRSGKLPDNQRMDWRGNSGLSDGSTVNVDLSKGYYDAGDNVKFNFPMAFSMTMLSWSVIEFGDKMGSDECNWAREAIRWGADYLLWCSSKVESENKLFAGIMNANVEHGCWGRPEDMDGAERAVYSVTAGSDLAAETAAALAAASIVFEKVESEYSQLLLNTSKVVMQFAMNNLGKYSDQISDKVCPFYCSSGYQDELLWGAAWMYKATKSGDYWDYIMNCENDETDFFSWDSKYPGANVLLATENLGGTFTEHAESFMCKNLNYQSTPATYTRGGLLMKLGDSPLEYVTSIYFLIAVYAKHTRLTNRVVQCGSYPFDSASLQNQAKAQVEYILGTNPKGISYMVGYRLHYPQRIHHRGSSLPSIRTHPEKIGCVDYYFSTPSPNLNILTGAVVLGPDVNDNFDDDRSRYTQSEPATYTNAPLVGILASLLP